MARSNTTDNRFSSKNLVKSDTVQKESETKTITVQKKDKVVTAKVYPETWAEFTAINKAQGMTNNSVINMLISEYVRNKKEILK